MGRLPVLPQLVDKSMVDVEQGVARARDRVEHLLWSISMLSKSFRDLYTAYLTAHSTMSSRVWVKFNPIPGLFVCRRIAAKS
jgi:hypothetical protein